jgi:hypothetical protein
VCVCTGTRARAHTHTHTHTQIEIEREMCVRVFVSSSDSVVKSVKKILVFSHLFGLDAISLKYEKSPLGGLKII